MRIALVIVAMGVFLMSPTPIVAAKAIPVQVSIWKPVQLFPEAWDVYGVRLVGVYGKNHGVYGLDIGGWCTSRDFRGIGLGIFGNYHDPEDLDNDVSKGILITPMLNWSERGKSCGLWIAQINRAHDFKGVQISVSPAPIVSINACNGNMTGVQFALGGNAVAGEMTGLQFAPFLNFTEAQQATGMQIAAFNMSGDFKGVQLGVLGNMCVGDFSGVQIGLINEVMGNFRGVQIGALNFSHKGMLPTTIGLRVAF